MKLLPVKTANEFVLIRPFDANDIDGLANAGANPKIWTHYVDAIDGEASSVKTYLESVLKRHQSGNWIAHTILTPDGEYVGQSCYMAIHPEHKGCEIGGTWYAPKFHGTKINPAAKLALLQNAFDCGAMRVELKTDENNLHSRTAILKLGAKFEGVFRKHMLRSNGIIRNTAYYAIIDDEWGDLKNGLLARLGE
ncbi:GNAT family N-acetyltransferase [Pseudaquidulcibacter saccharophilus]|uniref:GNAT family N-acetyltransferase n=1 Tax=Pseudaquidulcibacter saccharophilus TaxID=2831900 RepID=UPI001EFF4142|nr:GNAT family protein [Pseudaquidulcibacter saccharophilus]